MSMIHQENEALTQFTLHIEFWWSFFVIDLAFYSPNRFDGRTNQGGLNFASNPLTASLEISILEDFPAACPVGGLVELGRKHLL